MLRARLACVKPAASVRSEPGSNSHVENSTRTVTSLNRRELKSSKPHIHAAQSPSSHTQNVTVLKSLPKVRQSQSRPQPDRRNSADHVSLSSIFNCQKTEDTKPSHPSRHQTKPTKQNPTSQKGQQGKVATIRQSLSEKNQTNRQQRQTVSPETRARGTSARSAAAPRR